MNAIEQYKQGSKIHIKEKNKGSFTRWCGGNVTEECIRKGKASSNPKIRKKATFADNARHFKHKEGGIIKAADGSKFNWNGALSTGLNFVGQMLPSIIGGGNSSQQSTNNTDEMTNIVLQFLQLQLQDLALSNIENTLKSLYDPLNPNAFGGDIVKRHYKWMASQLDQLKELQKLLKELIDALNKLQKTNYITNALTNTLLTGFDLALNYKPTKKGSSVS